MSTALAIAGVTAVLRDLLNDGLDQPQRQRRARQQRHGQRRCAPDRVVPANGTEAAQLNLFLLPGHAQPRLAQRGPAGARRRGRTRLTNPPLALDLHYLLTAYGGGDLHAEILLGYAMQLLHETPVLTRDAIRTALQPAARRRHRAAAGVARARRLGLARPGRADQDHAGVPQHRGDVEALDRDADATTGRPPPTPRRSC